MPDVAHTVHRLTGGAILNPELVFAQNLDSARVERLQALHAEMHAMKQEFAAASAGELLVLKAEVQRIEYEMQEAWGWAKDASRHSHWCKVARCRCPEDLNWAVLGQGVRFVAEACPVHSIGDEVPGVRLMPFREDDQDVSAITSH